MNKQFLDWIEQWFRVLKSAKLSDLVPEKTTIVSVDMVKGFCSIGPLASPYVAGIIPSIVELFQKGHKAGIENFLLFQDTHHKETPEFGSYPPHCLKGSEESETIEELKILPFSGQFKIFEKNSLSPAFNTGFEERLLKNQNIENFIIVGNCTDLCIYSHAMHLRLSANAFNLKRRIIVPENCTATYNMSLETAKKLKAMPHDAETLQKIFLYHLALNGVEVVKRISD